MEIQLFNNLNEDTIRAIRITSRSGQTFYVNETEDLNSEEFLAFLYQLEKESENDN